MSGSCSRGRSTHGGTQTQATIPFSPSILDLLSHGSEDFSHLSPQGRSKSLSSAVQTLLRVRAFSGSPLGFKHRFSTVSARHQHGISTVFARNDYRLYAGVLLQIAPGARVSNSKAGPRPFIISWVPFDVLSWDRNHPFAFAADPLALNF